MKKLKQMSGPYSIGFELSSTAHGFVATDPNGNVLYHGKQPVMGTRVFKEGQHAAEARMPRTSRRGIQRRRGREHEMERVFAPVISPIDPDFFIRRRMSYKLGKIRFESDPIYLHPRSLSSVFHYTYRQRCFNLFADVWLEERVHRGAEDPPHRRAQVRSGCRGNGETRPFAKVIRLGDLFWRHIPVLWYNSPIHQSINRKE